MYPSEIKPEVLIEDPVRWDQSALNYERTVSKVRGTQQRADKKNAALRTEKILPLLDIFRSVQPKLPKSLKPHSPFRDDRI